MPEHQGLGGCPLTVDGVQVGVADPGCLEPDEDLAGPGRVEPQLLVAQRFPGPLEDEASCGQPTGHAPAPTANALMS